MIMQFKFDRNEFVKAKGNVKLPDGLHQVEISNSCIKGINECVSLAYANKQAKITKEKDKNGN
jgi:hypothetical protein